MDIVLLVPALGLGVVGMGSVNRQPHHDHDFMTKQTTVRLPDQLADDAEAVARVRGGSLNQLIIDSLVAEIERVRNDDFTSRARKLLERDREILDRLAK
jgi:hypothetical protein